MGTKTAIIGSIATLGMLLGLMLLGLASGEAAAPMAHETMPPARAERTSQFQRIEQPLWVKGAVSVGGLGLIGLELWWFLLSQPKSRKTTTQRGV